MFCNKCGQKLTTKAKSCSNCGAPSERAEYCGGFWGLVGEKTPVTPLPDNRREINGGQTAGSVQTGRSTSVKKRKRPVIWYVVCSVLLILCLVQTFRACHFSNEADKYQDWYEEEKEKNEKDEKDEESDDRPQNGESIRDMITGDTKPEETPEENPEETPEENPEEAPEENPDEIPNQGLPNPSTDSAATGTEASENSDANSDNLSGDAPEGNGNGAASPDGAEMEPEENNG